MIGRTVTAHSTQHTAHTTQSQHTAHRTCTAQSQHTAHSKQSQHTAQSTQQAVTAHSTKHTQHTAHITQHTAHSTAHSAQRPVTAPWWVAVKSQHTSPSARWQPCCNTQHIAHSHSTQHLVPVGNHAAAEVSLSRLNGMTTQRITV